MKGLGIKSLVLILLLLLCVTGCGRREEDQIAKPDTFSDAVISAEPDSGQTADSADEGGSTKSVTFYADDGTVFQIESIKNGLPVDLPSSPELSDGNIFEKWDHIPDSEQDSGEVRPVYQTVTDLENVFALPGAYGHVGDSIVIPLRLCGVVCLCGFDLTLEYDPEALLLESVFNEDGAVVSNSETPGVIHANFVSSDNTEADVDVFSLKFKVRNDVGETPITLKVISIYAWNEDNTFYTPNYNTIDATVFVYQ